MSYRTHFVATQEKHQKLEARIADELNHPSPDFTTLQTLKKQKLVLKEELERLRSLVRLRLDAA